MNEELLQGLADAFGVAPEIETVGAAVKSLIAQIDPDAAGDAALEAAAAEAGADAGAAMGAGETPPEGARPTGAPMAVDLPALRTALGLAEDSDEAAIAEALAAVLELLTMPAEPEAAMMSAGGEASPAASAGAPPAKTIDYAALRRAREAAARRAEEAVSDGLPYLVPAQGGAPGAGKRRGAPALLRGARPPGIADLVVAHRNGDARTLKALKAVGYNDGPSGGYMLNRLTSEELIEPLYAKEVVMAAGVRVERFEGAESMTVRKMRAGAAAYWAGAGQSVNDAEAQWGIVNLQPKELVARVLVYNRTLRNANARLEQSLRDDIVKAMRLAMDRAFLLGVGAVPGAGHSGAEPLGLLHTPNVTVTALGSGNGARPKLGDLIDAYGRIEDANVELTEDTAWIFHSRTKRTFTGLADANGQPLLRVGGWESGEEDMLLGYKWFTTTQVPINVTVGTNDDCSYIFLGVWSEAVVAISLDVELVIDTSRYINERQTLIQAVTYVDFGVFYPEAFEVITGVRA
ncbi:MAG: phage major capsid protein [Anaerolineae bacterium]|nr:phage major capsid protein [Anaerolineae bacterium]